MRSFGFNTPPLGALQNKLPFDTPPACGGVVHFVIKLIGFSVQVSVFSANMLTPETVIIKSDYNGFGGGTKYRNPDIPDGANKPHRGGMSVEIGNTVR